LEIDMINKSEMTLEDYEDTVIVEKMKNLLYALSIEDRVYIENKDELEEATRIIIEYFGIPQKDYFYEG
tara:strand:+ start:902 stop:1108 length:207 start_codon:yes stop_codon:yes gene_type:complete